jgi:pyruvate dehydrogenase E1 component beta subunit
VPLVAWSAAVVVAEQAAELAAAEDISCQVIDLRTLVPLDADGLGEAVSRTGRAVVVHEAPLTAGFGAEVVATIVEQAFWSLTAPIVRVAAPDTPYPIASLEALYVPSAERVLHAIRRVVQAS